MMRTSIRIPRAPQSLYRHRVIDSGATMGLHWFKQPKIVVEVKGGEILVTMPGTSLSVVYQKTVSFLPTPSLRERTRTASLAFRNFLRLPGPLLTRRQNK